MYSTEVREYSKWSWHVLYRSTTMIIILIYCIHKNSILWSLSISFLTNSQIFSISYYILHDGKFKALRVYSMKVHRCVEVTPFIFGVSGRWTWLLWFKSQPLSSRYSSNRRLNWPQTGLEILEKRKISRSCQDSNPISPSA